MPEPILAVHLVCVNSDVWAECGVTVPTTNLTADLQYVTCGRCRRTKRFQVLIQENDIPITAAGWRDTEYKGR